MSFTRDSSGDFICYNSPLTMYSNTTSVTVNSTLYNNEGSALSSLVPAMVESNKIYTHLYCYTSGDALLLSNMPLTYNMAIGATLYRGGSLSTSAATSEITRLGTIVSKDTIETGERFWINGNSPTTDKYLLFTSSSSYNNFVLGNMTYGGTYINNDMVFEFEASLPLVNTSTNTLSITITKAPGKYSDYTDQYDNYYVGTYNGTANAGSNTLDLLGLQTFNLTMLYCTKYLRFSQNSSGSTIAPVMVNTVNCSVDGQTVTITDISQPASLTIYDYKTCLTGDTLVTMSDRSIKRLDEIEVGDKVLSINPSTGKLVEDEVVFTDKDENKSHTEYDLWTFSNDYFVKTVHRHRFYNVEDNCFTYMDRWRIGDHTIDQNGNLIELIEHKTINETVKHYKITTKKYHNYFANGILTGSRLTQNFDYKNLSLGE
ncbi:MAG: hypothetical protein J5691_00400 [Bacilli bacterium]|nr:hypothetical protein [Bacilli bacterium]